MKDNVVRLGAPHNHEPDLRTLKRLEARKMLFEAAANSAPGTMKKTFDATLDGLEGGDSVGPYKQIYRTMRRAQEEKEKEMFDKEYDYDESDFDAEDEAEKKE